MAIRRAISGVALATIGAITLAGCTTPYVSEVVPGTEISVAWHDVISEFNGNSVTGDNAANNNVLYMTSSGFNHYDNTLSLVADTGFGSYVKLSDDPLTIKYTINDNVEWSDGVPIDGADLLLAWASTFGGFDDAGGPLFHHSNPLEGLATATPVVDGRSLTLVYQTEYADWEAAFDLGVAAHGTVQLAYPEIGDPARAKQLLVEAIKQRDVKWLAGVAAAWNTGYQATSAPDDPLVMLSSGPYVVESLVADDHVTLVANPAFSWGASPKYERITVREVDDAAAAFAAGEVELAEDSLTPELLELVQGLPGAEYAVSDGLSYEHVDLTFDNGGPFDAATYGGDEAKAALVRQAFLLTIPRQQIIDSLVAPMRPDASLRNSFLLMPQASGYDGMVESNGSDAYAARDIDAATALLAEAGVAPPVVVNFWYPLGDERRAAAFDLIVQSAARAGFNLVDKSEPDWAFLNKLKFPVNPHDAVIFAWQPTSLASAGVSEYLGTGRQSNYNGYSNPTVDALLQQLESEPNRERRAELMVDVEKQLWADGYGTVIHQYPRVTWWRSSVTGVSTMPVSPSLFWNFWQWSPPVNAE